MLSQRCPQEMTVLINQTGTKHKIVFLCFTEPEPNQKGFQKVFFLFFYFFKLPDGSVCSILIWNIFFLRTSSRKCIWDTKVIWEHPFCSVYTPAEHFYPHSICLGAALFLGSWIRWNSSQQRFAPTCFIHLFSRNRPILFFFPSSNAPSIMSR